MTVIECAAGFRNGGQNIDVRSIGREVLRRMSLEGAALARGTGEVGTAWIDANGKVAAQILTKDLKSDGPTAEMEILRGDLARLLYESVCQHATYHFGLTIQAVENRENGVKVCFSDGTTETYDMLVIAEGVGSPTRDLVFPDENDPRWMNLAIAYFTIPRIAGDDRLWRWYHASGGWSISLRPGGVT